MGLRMGHPRHVSLRADYRDHNDHLFLFSRDSTPCHTVIGEWEGCERPEKRSSLYLDERAPVDKAGRTIFSQFLMPESVLFNQL